MSFEDRLRSAIQDEADGGRLPLDFTSRVMGGLPGRHRLVRWRFPLAAVGTAAAAILAVALVTSLIAVGSRPTASPASTVPTSAATTASALPTVRPSDVASADSLAIPAEIGGEPVFRRAIALAHAAFMDDASTFLVGGTLGSYSMICPAPIASLSTVERRLVSLCDGVVLDGMSGVHLVGDEAWAWPQFRGVDVVIRVHTHDARASECPAALRPECEAAIVADMLVWVAPASTDDHRATVVDAAAGRYDDGLPRSVGGQPVHRGGAALAFANASTDESSFLIGGWLTVQPGLSACIPTGPAGAAWLGDCGRPTLSDRAGIHDAAIAPSVTFRFASGVLGSGPVVASVHVHDPRAAECTNSVDACDRMMVVERVLWTGDSATDPRGLDADAVATALRSVDPNLSMMPLGPDSLISGCAMAMIPAAAEFVVIGGAVDPPGVTMVQVASTSQGLARAIPEGRGADAALKANGVACTSISGGAGQTHPGTVVSRRLAFDNVVLLVATHQNPTAADRAFLDRLAAALQQADSLYR